MSGRFAESAARLAGLAGAMLGWRPDEFWRSTPEELAVLFRAMARDADNVPLDRAGLSQMQEMFPDG
jgi:uncharacterized phage protein (TIGR02216 family)